MLSSVRREIFQDIFFPPINSNIGHDDFNLFISILEIAVFFIILINLISW